MKQLSYLLLLVVAGACSGADTFPMRFFFALPESQGADVKEVVFRILTTEKKALPKEDFPDGGHGVEFSAEFVGASALGGGSGRRFVSMAVPGRTPFEGHPALRVGQVIYFRLHQHRGQFLYGVIERIEEADPGGRDNAREVTVIRMAQLRSAYSVLQKGSLHARPRVSHL
ncbi:MAG: hypothetical protein NDI75_15295 [Candidatus Didemnitutus sp.]|nr:hypothetical protein [Candidatus Didemnitutus sp.]